MLIEKNHIYHIDALHGFKRVDDNFVDCIVTSPPYWGLRDYGVSAQYGLEKTYKEYINKLIEVFTEAKRTLKNTGTLWVNIGDTYGGSGKSSGYSPNSKNFRKHPCEYKTIRNHTSNLLPKSLIGIPFRFAIEMIDSGWILRNTIIWHKPNAMPHSTKDRFTNDFEYLFFFTKSKKYYFEQQLEPYTEPLNRWTGNNQKMNGKGTWSEVTRQNIYRDRMMRPNPKGRNKRTIWSFSTRSFKGAHFAVFPETLIETPIKAGCPSGDPPGIVLDPFMGSGTTAVVAKRFGRDYIGFDINKKYIDIANQRVDKVSRVKL